MAEGGESIILEDFLLVEDVLLLEEMAEEDEELDLYNEMTFGLDRDSTEEDVPKLLVVPEMSPEVAEALVEATGTATEQLEELAEEEGGVEAEMEQVDSQMEEEVEELGTEEQEEDQECFEEPSELGDPAVMRAVRSKPTLESQDSAVLDSRIGTCWGEFGKEDMLSTDPTALGSCPDSVPRHLMLEMAGYGPPAPFQPGSPTVGSPPRSLGMHFRSMSSSLDPALFFSPSAMGQLNFSTPSHMTQLHPQHQRILMQQQGRQAQSVSPKKLWSHKVDPYAGLMTSKEKDWVVKVQMMQLQSENMDDDYYYQTYYHRLERKQAEEELLGRRNKPPKLVTPFIQKVETYDSVVRIAGSLGQVTVSTCYSPRRAIDAVHHALVEEELFLQLLEVEEVQQKMSPALGEKQPHGQEQKTQKVESIYQALKIRACSSEEEAEDEFLQLLCVRKGKKLVARLLPHLIGEQREKILLTITHHLPFLMKKDMLDEASTPARAGMAWASLPLLYSPLNEVVGAMTFSKLIEVLQELTQPLPESLELPLTMALKNQFGISLLYSLLSHGERLLSSCAPLKPCRGDFEAWTDMVYLMSQELSRLPTASLAEPLFLPSNLVLLFCRYLDKQTVYQLAAKMAE
ncbi:hypothetical protein DUI87_29305 [Hirundo rustica rustica]|uniref:mRNA decay factor PAT1 domain-containing protein n=1 Tax=Hirundo rustica rustica TaxID=333673 RepID=A0A3M0J0M7_HIRRU|nr:hypothetical protein DUI87_29305 [Hirundo rustica rustica]